MVGTLYFSETLLPAFAAPDPNGPNRKLTLFWVIICSVV
ncbi:Uncharacterised protein [Mycobacterium tuberculosis]|nr:Uncharacterised protein [Mycobacterium tuberculosis]